MTREEVKKVVYESIADAFMLEESEIFAHSDWNFRTDLNATSLQYFPLISDIEERLDIELEAHEFQWVAKTIEQAVDFVYTAYAAQK